MKSSKFTLKQRDFIKGLIIAVLAPVFTIITQSITAGGFVFDWKVIGGAALVAFMAYITKNFFTDDVEAAEKVLTEARQDAIKENKNINT